MRIAFKEWAVVVDALGRGDQILILRKGGIAEGRGGFQVEHPSFLLFPTLFHQQRESVIPAAQERFDELSRQFTSTEAVRLDFYAEVVSARRIDSLSAAESLRGQHVWRDEVVAQRFDCGREKNLFALAVRIHRLPLTIELPMLPAYGGCKSWVELEKDVSLVGVQPVLDQPAFDHKLRQFHSALNPGSSLRCIS